jgi:hypothetical protein
MRLKAMLVAISMLFATTPALAGTIVCAGTVELLAFHANDILLVQLSSMNTPVQYCRLNQDWNEAPGYTTTPTACKALLAMFTSAKAMGAVLNSVYFDGPSVPSTCSGWAGWSSANIRYFNY